MIYNFLSNQLLGIHHKLLVTSPTQPFFTNFYINNNLFTYIVKCRVGIFLPLNLNSKKPLRKDKNNKFTYIHNKVICATRNFTIRYPLLSIGKPVLHLIPNQFTNLQGRSNLTQAPVTSTIASVLKEKKTFYSTCRAGRAH